MKRKSTIAKFVAMASIFAGIASNSHAQNNVGVDCGCPPVSSRTTSVNLSSLADANGKLTAANTILDCTKMYHLDKKIYVPAGKILTILPGTVIKCDYNGGVAANATALVVSRDGKIIADGSPTCQIVFTSEFDNMDDNNPYGIENKGKWGGIAICGRATNNFVYTKNGPYSGSKIAVDDGLAGFEGFASTNEDFLFGADLNGPAGPHNGPTETFNDDDNSGILRYVSIRHSGAILTVGAEINALSLGSVGRGTTIEHLEVISCADDNVELWGGTVNLKYCNFMFGNDDMFDFDCGWSGKVQFIFGIKGGSADLTNVSPDNDNGFEMDADDQQSNELPRSHPRIYNATLIGNNKRAYSADNSGIAAIQAKELTEGEIYNSVFANWRAGVNLFKTMTSGRSLSTGGNTCDNWHDGTQANRVTAFGNPQSLIIKCNTFVNVDSAIVTGDFRSGAGWNTMNEVTALDSTQFFTADMNIVVSSLPGFDYTWAINGATNIVTDKFDAVPNPALSVTGCPTPPMDGFYSPANYRGAFASVGKNWLSDFAYQLLVNASNGFQICPTDINGSGKTDNSDFLLLLGKFNQDCQ